MAKTREQIKAGIDFAREHNLRLIIRNTGHDFMGRSTGFGSLIINTHSFKDVKFLTAYSGPGNWTGGAAIVGAGVQGRELFRQAFAQKPPVVIVGGECPVSLVRTCAKPPANTRKDCGMGWRVHPGRGPWSVSKTSSVKWMSFL